jgi:hypothetical protein
VPTGGLTYAGLNLSGCYLRPGPVSSSTPASVEPGSITTDGFQSPTLSESFDGEGTEH